jgi:hypothetical protein
MFMANIHAAPCERCSIEAIDGCSVEQKLTLIDQLHEEGYIAWSRDDVASELDSNARMVRLLGGQGAYLREWIKLGLANASSGRFAGAPDAPAVVDDLATGHVAA